MKTPQEKGRSFEDSVYELLENLARTYPDTARVSKQPRVELHDGQTVIPDFELQFDLIFEESRYLIECQDRNRSTPTILQKIKYVKGLSDRNRFIFVYSETIADTTRDAMDADGVMYMSFLEFDQFLLRLALQLASQKSHLKKQDYKKWRRGCG